MDNTELFKEKIAEYLEIISENVYLYWKGRVALYGILKAIGLQKGDEVVLPAFTCVVVSNAIMYLGGIPVYVDINPETLNMDIKKMENTITDKTKVILAQNTFGLSSDLDKIMEIAAKRKIFVVEDCAHGFGGFYKGKKNGTIADASFFSTQWNKPFSTGIGGIAVINNKKIAENMKKVDKEAEFPSFFEKLFLTTLIFVKEKIITQNLFWIAIKLYRFLSKHNLIIGSSQGGELEKPTLPNCFFKKMGEFQAKKGIIELENINNNISHRKKTAEKYFNIFKKLGVSYPNWLEMDHSFLKFPLFVKNRKLFLKLAEEAKVELGDWFVSPIHPIEKDFHLWNYVMGSNKIGEKYCEHIVNLPTHLKINNKELDKIEKFLFKCEDQLIKNYRELGNV